MVAKCANPQCSNRFLYLRDGRLFRVEVPAQPTAETAPVPDSDASSLVAGKKPSRRVEHYWLCNDCAASYTVAYHEVDGIVAVPLCPLRKQAAAS